MRTRFAGAAIAVLAATLAWAQAPPGSDRTTPSTQQPGTTGSGQQPGVTGGGQQHGTMMHPGQKTDMTARCQAMMQRHKQMMSQMQQMDTRLSQLADKMNAAKGNDRLDAVVAVVNEMVQERQQMRKQMAEMPMAMMGHAMDHMAANGMHVNCPMMQGSGMEGSKTPGGSQP